MNSVRAQPPLAGSVLRNGTRLTSLGEVSYYLSMETKPRLETLASQDAWITVNLEFNRSVPQMANRVRPAEVTGKRTTLTAFLSAYLSPNAADERYEWLYFNNPEGPARVWVACEAESAALRLRDVGLGRSNAWTITEETGPCGEEFTIAFRQWAPAMGTCASRTAEYLNWRFMQHPQRRYQFLTTRRDGNGRLCGYLIYHWAGEDATVDLLGEEDDVCKALLVETIAILRGCGVNTLSAPFLRLHAGREILEDCGFQPRESTPVVVLSLPWAANSQGDHGAEQ